MLSAHHRAAVRARRRRDSTYLISMPPEKAYAVFEGSGRNHHRFNSVLRIVALLDQNEHMAKIVFKQLARSSNE